MDQGEGKVLVEEVVQEVANAEVGPASVHQQEPPQVPKLSEGVVGGQDRLHPLLTADADADVSGSRRTTTQSINSHPDVQHQTDAEAYSGSC